MFSLTRQHNAREIARNATLIIGMSGKQTTISNPEDPKAEPRKFAFDYSYWSHDEYKERPDGYLEPSGARYADQVSNLCISSVFKTKTSAQSRSKVLSRI